MSRLPYVFGGITRMATEGSKRHEDRPKARAADGDGARDA